MEWDWNFALKILPQLFEGVIVTIQATILGSLLSFVLGLFLAVGKKSSFRSLSFFLIFFISVIRGTPLLVQLYILFYVFPDFGFVLSPLTAGVIGLGVHYSTYMSEVFRAGIENIDTGQWEAGKALNMSKFLIWKRIIIPQSIPPMIPVLGNYFISMFKETPLLSAITVLELMNNARSVANFTYRYFEPMTMVGIFFLLVSIPPVIIFKKLENKKDS